MIIVTATGMQIDNVSVCCVVMWPCIWMQVPLMGGVFDGTTYGISDDSMRFFWVVILDTNSPPRALGRYQPTVH